MLGGKRCANDEAEKTAEERSLIQLCDEFSAFSTVYANAIVFRVLHNPISHFPLHRTSPTVLLMARPLLLMAMVAPTAAAAAAFK